MNRAMRRHDRDKILEEIQIKAQIAKIKRDAITYALETSVAIMATNLHQLHGFGKKRIEKLVDKLNYTFECIDKDTVDINDFHKYCEEKFKINFKTKVR